MVKSNTSTASESETGPVSDSSPNHGNLPIGRDVSPGGQPLPERPGLGRRIWNRWLKVAEVIGTVQMMIILSIIYWLILPFFAVPFRIFSDPLRIRRRQQSNWHEKKRDDSISTFDSMRNQY